MHLLGMVYNFIIDWLFWLINGLARVLVALVAVPYVFFMPRGKAYQHLSYGQTLTVRLKFIGKTIATAFKSGQQ